MELTKEFQLVKEVDLGNFTGWGNIYLRTYARVSSEGYDIVNNRTKVYVKSVLYNSGEWFDSYGSTTASVSCTGLTTVSGKKEQRYYKGETTLFETSGYVTHNNDGTKTINVSGSWVSTPWGISGTASDNVTLPRIPRYFTSTPSLTYVSKTAYTINVNWSTSETCSEVRYKVDSNGAWVPVTNDANTTSGSFQVSGLSPGTNYTIYAEFTRKDSGIASQSNTLNVTTLGYATCSHSLDSKGINQIVVNWSSDKTIDHVWYDIHGSGNWIDVGNPQGSSGSYSIGGLEPNTTYWIRTKVKSSDSQLETISSDLAVTTYDYAKITSAINITDEQNPYFTFTNPSGISNSFYLEFSVTPPMYQKSIARYEISNVGEYTLQLTEDERVRLRQENLKNANNYLTIRYVLVTVENGIQYNSIADRTMTIVNANPVFNNFYWWVDDRTIELCGSEQAVIKGYSDVITYIDDDTKAQAKKEASIKSYQTTIGGKTNSTTNISYPLRYEIADVDTASIQVFATDNRNNSTSVTKTISNFIDYVPIKKTFFEVKRTQQINSEVRLHFEGEIDLVNFGAVTNSIKSCNYYYNNKLGETTLTPQLIHLWDSKYKIIIDQIIYGDLGKDGFDINNSYSIRIDIYDELSNISENGTLGTGSPAYALYKNNISLGGPYDKNIGGRVQINGEDADNIHKFKNLFNINKVTFGSGTGCTVTDGVIKVNKYSNSSQQTLKELAPTLEVGKTYFLSGKSTTADAPYIYIGESWYFGSAKTITQSMLDHIVNFYGNYEPVGNNTQVSIWDIQIEENNRSTEIVPFRAYILESGENSNGHWIKYSDGTMICYKTMGGDASNLQLWAGNTYYEDIDSGSWAKPFKTLLNVQTSSNYSQYWIINHNASSTSSGQIRLLRPDGVKTYYNVQILGIGRWI